jgi:predicted transcriptional regulator
MATSTAVELIAVSPEARRVLRDLRTQLGLSRATIERRARVGTDYMKHLESGQYPRLEASRLRRVVQVLQQAAARRQVSAPLTTRFARVVKVVGQPGKSAGRR